MPLLQRLLAGTFMVFLFAGCSTAPQTPSADAELGVLMAERLALAREVARSKHRSGAAVHDPVREAAILASLTDQAATRGLPRKDAEAFLTAQIAASRQVQTELLARWAAGESIPAGEPLNLRTEIRPRLDDVTSRLLDSLAAVHRRNEWSDATSHAGATLSSGGYSRETIDLALAPLEAQLASERRAERTERQRRRMLRPRPAFVD